MMSPHYVSKRSAPAANAHTNGNTLHHLVSQLHHSGVPLTPTFSSQMTLLSPYPFSLPLHSQTYISRQQTNMAASRTATRPGDAHSATLFLRRGPPNIHTVGLSISPAQKYIRRGAHPSLSQPMANCRSPTLGKQWSHCPSPTFGTQWSHCPFPNLREAVEP